MAVKAIKEKPGTNFSKKQYMLWYEKMLLMRRFEEKCGQLYIQQKFGGFCHLYIGQEALLAGMITAIEKKDRVITAYRDHAHPLALGTEAKYVMAELFGKTTGTSKGKGGSMHMFDKERNLFGGHGIVGGQIPLGAGLAFADKYKKTGSVTFCSMGDGAVRQGALHETFNMAMTWKLPIVFIIENNHYAMGTSVERTSNVTHLHQLASAYSMPAQEVNGMSCQDCHTSLKIAGDHARNGKGPFLLEVMTYRYKGHSMSDPAKYRTKAEVESYKQQDPIEQVKTHIIKSKIASESELTEISKRIVKEINESVEFAEQSLLPKGSELYNDVYSESGYPFIKES